MTEREDEAMTMDLTYEPGAMTAAPSEDAPVSSLVALAIEKGVDVAVLERLVALQERVTERNARAAFFEAVASFQEQCPEIRKSKEAKIATKSGANFSYSYAPLEEITRTIRPVLKANGLSYSWDVASDGGRVMNVVCVLRHVEGHEERATFPVPVETGGRMSDAQANGGALTYGKRQSLTSVLGLTTTDSDNDARQGRGVEPITGRQAADLRALMDEVAIDKDRFLKWLGVATIADLPASEYNRALTTLERKRGER